MKVAHLAELDRVSTKSADNGSTEQDVINKETMDTENVPITNKDEIIKSLKKELTQSQTNLKASNENIKKIKIRRGKR